jgi:hypothetical protein
VSDLTEPSTYTPREEAEIEEMARIIWIGWDDEWTDLVKEIQLSASRLYVMGYRKTNLKLDKS